MFDEDPNQTPPTPPPPIVLHPQPYSDSRFFTPFLLQAIILGASALGLFTRSKVRRMEGQKGDKDRLVSRTARQEAEERVDGVQALNLLISAHAVRGAFEVEDSKVEVWRKEGIRPLVNLVSQAIKSEQPLNRLGVASILHFVSTAPSDTLTASSQREASSLLFQQAAAAYQALPTPDSSSPDFPLDLSIQSSLRSLANSSKDQSLLDTLGNRILSSPNDYPPELLHQFGQTAVRAKRLDIVTRLLSLDRRLPTSLRPDLAITALDLAASRQEWRNDRETILPLAEAFTMSIEQRGELDKGGIDQLDRGIYLLRTAFSIDRPLEPFISRAALSTLAQSSLLANKKYRSILLDVLRHLTRSRNPTLARQVFSAIPSDHLRLSYFVPLLSSSHATTSQFAWDLLLSHPSLPLTPAAASARFTSLSHRSASPSTLETARQDFQLVEDRGINPSIDIWNKLLHVIVRFGGDRAVKNTLSAMEKAGIEQNEFTRTILLQREMIRQDEQVRMRRRGGGNDREASERMKRRGGGLAQMRKIKEAIREGRKGGGSESQGIDITPNLLLKNFTRWTVECDTKRLLQLTKVVVGVDLIDHSPSSINWPNSTPSRLPLSSSSPPQTHALSSSVLDMSKEEYDKLRVPAFRTLISAFERRGRNDLAKELRRRFRVESDEVKLANCSRGEKRI